MLADCGGVLMSELDGHVREGTYGVVIGDFVKGYFLTELLGALMRRYDNIPVLHIRGSLKVIEQRMMYELCQQSDAFRLDDGQRVLLVTESIGSGRTMGKFSRVLQTLGMPFDIAVGTMEKDLGYYTCWGGPIPSAARVYCAGMDSGEFMKAIAMLSKGLYQNGDNISYAITDYGRSQIPLLVNTIAYG